MAGVTQTRALDRAGEPPAGVVVARSLAEDAETYNSSVAGVEIQAVRAGPGTCPTQVLAVVDERFTFTNSKVGFSMLSQTTVPDDMVTLAYMRAAPPGCRWCEFDVEPGSILAYGPGAEHTARNLPGIDFMFAILERSRLDEYAKSLGIQVEIPLQGQIHRLALTAKTKAVGPAFAAFADATANEGYPPAATADGVLRAVTHALREDDRVRRIGSARRINSRHVVHNCLDYANAVQRIPSISELCLAAHVSERRLRQAFTDEFDLPPSQYFRAWALNEAHDRLAHSPGDQTTVTNVACGLGFDHLGRFAGHYKQIYGETPSTTLRISGDSGEGAAVRAESGYPLPLTSFRVK